MNDRIFGWVVGLLLVAIAGPALAAPALFSGNVTLTSGYRKNFYTPSGPDPFDYGTVFSHVGTPSGTLSVTPGGDFTVPPSTFKGGFTSTTVGFPGYPYFYVANIRTQLTGNFSAGFLPPDTTLAFYADTTAFPNSVMNPRQGTVRLNVGPNGFGGYMGIYENILYTGLWQGGVGVYDFYQFLIGTPGLDPAGAVSSNLLFGTRTNTTNSGIMFKSEGPGTNFPWITGTLTLLQTDGYYSTVRTVTVSDNRTATASGFTGSISLVSARVINIYNRIGSTIQNKSEGWGRTTRINLEFLPEAGRLSLLAAGALGLLGLYRLRRR